MRNIAVHILCESGIARCPQARLKRLVRTVCRQFGAANVRVTVAVTGNDTIRHLSRRFLNRGKVTDCLAFDLSDETGRWFDLVVNGQKAAIEATGRGHSPQAELALYVTHALLHTLGLDDRRSADAARMHRLEDKILSEHGFGPVYSAPRKRPRDSRPGRTRRAHTRVKRC